MGNGIYRILSAIPWRLWLSVLVVVLTVGLHVWYYAEYQWPRAGIKGVVAIVLLGILLAVFIRDVGALKLSNKEFQSLRNKYMKNMSNYNGRRLEKARDTRNKAKLNACTTGLLSLCGLVGTLWLHWPEP